jgi:exodeoxyribonuclease VII large subunit
MSESSDPAARRILTVRQLNEAIQSALLEAFAQPVWVRGEVQRLPADAARRTHVYFELHEGGKQGAASYQIPAAILGWDRDRYQLGRYLDGSDPAFRLQDRLEVCLLGRVDFYPPYGKVSLKVVGVDPEFSLGQLEARRRQVLAWLEKDGLLRLNATRELAELPLRLGLITSAGSAAEEDVVAGLRASGYPFRVVRADCRMQGEQTARQVIAALARLAQTDVQAILIARGGGSRADLSWFDQQDLCAAVARCPVPVIAAIGHEIDTSLVDLCAHTRCKTPTAAAAFLVERIQVQERRLQAASERLPVAVQATLGGARRRLDDSRRLVPAARRCLRDGDRRLRTVGAGLAARTGRAVARSQRRLQALAGDLAHGARQLVAAARRQPDYLARRLQREVPRTVLVRRQRLSLAGRSLAQPARRRLAALSARLDLLAARTHGLDPRRQLERGFTLTLDSQGRLLRSAAGLGPGMTLRTRFADGEVTSRIAGPAAAAPPPNQRQKGNHGDEEDSGQQALF